MECMPVRTFHATYKELKLFYQHPFFLKRLPFHATYKELKYRKPDYKGGGQGLFTLPIRN